MPVYDEEKTDDQPYSTRNNDGLDSRELDEQENDANQQPDDATDTAEAQSLNNKLGRGYREESGRRFAPFGKKGGMSGQKKGLLAGGGGAIAIMLLFILFFVSQLKVVHFSDILTASGYARLHSILNERTAQNMFDAAVADGNPVASPGKPSMWNRLRGADPQAELAQLGREGRFKFVFDQDKTTFSLRKSNMFQGVRVDGKTVSLAEITQRMGLGDSYYKLIDPRKKAAVRYEFTKQAQGLINDGFATESRVVRSNALSIIAENVGFKFSKWRQEGRAYVGMDGKAARSENLAETNKNVRGGTKPIKTGVASIDETTEEVSNNAKIREYLEKNGNNPDLSGRVMEAFQRHNAQAAKIQSAASSVGQITMLASLACMTNLAFNHIPEIERANQKQAEATGLDMAAAGSQIREGATTGEAIGGESGALDNAETAPAYQKAIGNPNPDVPSSLRSSKIRDSSFSDSTTFKLIETLTSPSTYLGPAALVIPDKYKDQADQYLCSKLLSPEGLLTALGAEIVAQAGIALLSDGTGTVATEAGGAVALKALSLALVKSSWTTVKGLVGPKGLATLGAFGAYGVGLDILVNKLASQSFSGLDTGPTRLENAFTGTEAVQNHQQREILYGRPLSIEERKAQDAEAQTEIQLSYNSGNVFSRYLSTSNPYSVTSKTLAYMPSSVGNIGEKAQTSATWFANTLNPGGLLKSVLRPASVHAADQYEDPKDTMQAWGYSMSELEKMRTPEYGVEQNSAWVEPRLAELDAKYGVCFRPQDQYDADELAKTPTCSAETLATDEALRYRLYQGLDSYILKNRENNESSATDGSVSTQFAAMSYNVMGADKDGPSWDTRKGPILSTISEKSPDIIGFQEINEDVQFEDLQTGLSDYSMWDGGDKNERPIFWKTALFDKEDGGIYKYQRYSDNQPAPWVKLKNKADGSDLYVFNYHGVAQDSNADKKVQGAKDLVKSINDIAGDSAPVLLTGDFNSKTGDFADPIIKAAGFVDTYETAATKINGEYDTHGDIGKPRGKEGKHLDHIYIRPSTPVPSWENVVNNATIGASDHSPIIATIGSNEEDETKNLQTGQLCTINDKSLNESSGLAASIKHPGIVYTHNDEGNTIYAVEIDTCKVVGKFKVNGVRSDPDPEAITIDHTTGKIWFGDIGNGHPNQPFSDKTQAIKYKGLPARIIVFDEPDQFSGSVSGTKLDIKYSTGDQNSEALLANPKTGQGWIINKGPQSTVFKLPNPIKSGTATATNTKINGWVTDASFTNDGKYILVRYRTEKDASPKNVYVYDSSWNKVGDIPVPKVDQGESITMDQDGPYFIIGSESKQGKTPMVRVALPPEFGGTQQAQAPSGNNSSSGTAGNISLKRWKITLPICDGGEAKEIKQPALDAYVAAGGSQWFKKTTAGLDFYVDSKGACTTGGSENPRSELREMNSNGSNEYNWSPSSGTHRMLIKQKVSELKVKGDGAGVVIGQIHDVGKSIDDYTVFRLEGKTLYAFIDGKKSSSKVIDANFPIGKEVTMGFSVENGTVKFLYDRNGGSSPGTVASVKYPSGSKGAYFKAGNYCQCGKDGRSGSTRVVISGLGVTHDNTWPAIASIENDNQNVTTQTWDYFGVLSPPIGFFTSQIAHGNAI